eukprot:6105513-Amphidinium_carterae.1
MEAATAPGQEEDSAIKADDQTSTYYSDTHSSPRSLLLWRHLHLGGDTSEAQDSWSTLCWDRALTERLRSSVLSSCLRKGVLRFCTRSAGSALAIPKASFRWPAPPQKAGPFPRGHLFGSEHASGGPGAKYVLCFVLSDSKGEVSEDSSLRAVLPGERSEGQVIACVLCSRIASYELSLSSFDFWAWRLIGHTQLWSTW